MSLGLVSLYYKTNVASDKDLVHTAELSMVVPKECVPYLIGLKGRKIADTQKRTGTRIDIFPRGNMQEVVLIKGDSYEKCLQAR